MVPEMSIFHLLTHGSDLPTYQLLAQLELIQMYFPHNLFSWII